MASPVAAATTTGDKGFERSQALVDAEVDGIIIDTAHGHNRDALKAVERAKTISNSVQIIAGNGATAEATRALIDAGADAVKVGLVQADVKTRADPAKAIGINRALNAVTPRAC